MENDETKYFDESDSELGAKFFREETIPKSLEDHCNKMV